MQRRLAADPLFDPAFDQLFDLGGVTDFKLPEDYIRGGATRSVFAPESRRVLVAPTDLAYGLARMFAAWNGGAKEAGFRVFRKKEEAVRWLEERE